MDFKTNTSLGIAVFDDGICTCDLISGGYNHYEFQDGLALGKEVTAVETIGSNIVLLALEGENRLLVCQLDETTHTARILARSMCGGADSSCLKVHPSGKFLISVSGRSGTVSVIALGNGQAVGGILCQAASPGKTGPNRLRQLWSHPSAACFDESGRDLLVCDTGNDAVNLFRLDDDGTLSHRFTMQIRPGSCPLEIVCGANGYFYVLSDGIESLYCCRLDTANEALIALSIVQPLSEYYTGLSVACRDLSYLPEERELIFILPDSLGFGRFKTENGLITDKQWIDSCTGISMLSIVGGKCIAASGSSVFIIRNNKIIGRFGGSSAVRAVHVIAGGKYDQ